MLLKNWVGSDFRNVEKIIKKKLDQSIHKKYDYELYHKRELQDRSFDDQVYDPYIGGRQQLHHWMHFDIERYEWRYGMVVHIQFYMLRS